MKTIKTIAAAGLLLGTTSVMAQVSPTTTGDFTFTIEEVLGVSCSSATEVTDVADMIVDDLEDAVATVSCTVTTNAPGWNLSLTAENAGKMENDDVTSEFLKVDGVDGILGMWVELTSADNSATIKAGTRALVTAGTPVTAHGKPIAPASLAAKVNLAQVLETGAPTGTAHLTADKNAGTVGFDIRAAFVGGTEITSAAGSYTQTIQIDVDSSL